MIIEKEILRILAELYILQNHYYIYKVSKNKENIGIEHIRFLKEELEILTEQLDLQCRDAVPEDFL